ncbi:hypothetical protein ANCCAN_25248 [Ancylostoma caninum]|uniref:Uncharacterized protein n=1 Tax=Ancylostoma caninum TaxID=29170 RepID=A0A368F9Z9_ANCCA|nr:hypothetical protein ANCCAN_25248 [Ancylostoma caninum]
MQKQITNEGRERKPHYAKRFGAMNINPASGTWKIPASEFGPGCDIADIYLRLQLTTSHLNIDSAKESKQFFEQFIRDIVVSVLMRIVFLYYLSSTRLQILFITTTTI